LLEINLSNGVLTITFDHKFSILIVTYTCTQMQASLITSDFIFLGHTLSQSHDCKQMQTS